MHPNTISFQQEVAQRLAANGANASLKKAAHDFLLAATQPKYCYNFEWLGRPIIQYPQDIVAMQELIWRIKPDLIIETGIAHGGSLIFSASLLAMLEMCEAIEEGRSMDPARGKRMVLGIDIDIRSHNLEAINQHPMASRIRMIQGSSIDPEIIQQVRQTAKPFKTVLVCLDSNHTHEHVLAELKAYADLTSLESYCVVFDTLIEDLPAGTYPDRSWDPGNNPMSAVFEYLKTDDRFLIDEDMNHKLLITVGRNGFLRRTKA